MFYKRVYPEESGSPYTDENRYDALDAHAYELEYGVWCYLSFYFPSSEQDRTMIWNKEIGVTEYHLAFASIAILSTTFR